MSNRPIYFRRNFKGRQSIVSDFYLIYKGFYENKYKNFSLVSTYRWYNYLMKIKDMTKQQLINRIEFWQKMLHTPKWVREQSNFKLGSRVVHLAKLREELESRA